MFFILKNWMKFQTKSLLIQFWITFFFEWSFNFLNIYTSSLYIAVQHQNVEIIKILLEKEGIDINLTSVFKNLYIFIQFQNYYFLNDISN